MISETLEQDLQTYAKHRRQSVFNKIYLPLTNVLRWLCHKQYSNITNEDFNDVKQMVMLKVIKDIKYYKPTKGTTALSFVRMLMSQELMKQKRKIESGNNHNTTYLDEIEIDLETISPLKDLTDDYQMLLEQYQHTAPDNQKKIVGYLIQEVSAKNTLGMTSKERKEYISKVTGMRINLVSETLRDIRKQKLRECLNAY